MADQRFIRIYSNLRTQPDIIVLLRGNGIDGSPAYAVTPIGCSECKHAPPLLPYALVGDLCPIQPVTWVGSHLPVPPQLLNRTVEGPTLLDVLHGLKKYQSAV